MKLYTADRAPNPRRVHMFLAEKNISVERVPVDINKLEHKTEAFVRMNPSQRIPVLVLDDGTAIAESIAICRYFEVLEPSPPLFGTDAKSQALVEMWNRRVEFGLMLPLMYAFRHRHPAMAEMEKPQVPEWADANRPKAEEFMRFLDTELAGREFIAGDAFSVADISAVVAIDFARLPKIAVPEGLQHLQRWHAAVSARPSAKA